MARLRISLPRDGRPPRMGPGRPLRCRSSLRDKGDAGRSFSLALLAAPVRLIRACGISSFASATRECSPYALMCRPGPCDGVGPPHVGGRPRAVVLLRPARPSPPYPASREQRAARKRVAPRLEQQGPVGSLLSDGLTVNNPGVSSAWPLPPVMP